MSKRGVLVVAVSLMGVLALAPAAHARNAYVTNSGDGTVSVLDAGSGALLGSVFVGGEPVDVAIAPDGSVAYVVNRVRNAVDAIDTRSNAVVATIAVGKDPAGIAIAPNGAFAYVTNSGDDTVSLIATGANATVGSPIAVGKEPDGVAVTPDSSTVYVAQRGGGIAIVPTATNAVSATIEAPHGPSRIALTPAGNRGFATNSTATSVTAFNPATGGLIDGQVAVDGAPAGIAVDPEGGLAFAALPAAGAVTPIDTTASAALTAPVPGFPGATGVGFPPAGGRGFVTDGSGSAVTLLDLFSRAPVGLIGAGAAPTAVAVVPNQGPKASFWVSPARKRAQTKLTFHGGNSTDADGRITRYAWDFGDGRRASGAQPTRSFNYRRPGTYLATLAVTDDENCANTLVFTGQTAYCNGSPAAVFTTVVEVGDTSGPVLQVRGAKSQRLAPRVTLRARCPRERCSLVAHGVVATTVESGGKAVTRNLRVRGMRVGKLSRSWRALRLRLPAKARRAAYRAQLMGGTAKVRFSVVARDAEGERSLRQRNVDLR